jgi:hypothetical protein
MMTVAIMSSTADSPVSRMPVLRRTTSAFLVRRALAKTVADAAEFLGLRLAGHGLGTPITRWARRQGTPEAYERAVDAIAAELTSSPLIDYRHRRALLADWALPPDTWHQIADQLKRRPSPRYVSDDRARLADTAYIWTHVTHGETQFTPRPAEARNDPELNAAWSQDRFTIGHWLRQNKQPYFQQMKPLLDAYATQLTVTGRGSCMLEPVSINLFESRGRSRLARRVLTAVHITRALRRRLRRTCRSGRRRAGSRV